MTALCLMSVADRIIKKLKIPAENTRFIAVSLCNDRTVLYGSLELVCACCCAIEIIVIIIIF